MNRLWSLVFLLLVLSPAIAGADPVPFVNLEGVGGVAFNPLAYVAGASDSTHWASQPRFGLWHVTLDKVDVDWTAYGAAFSLFNRVELSAGHEAVSLSSATTIEKNSLGAKLLVVNENAGGLSWVPAISVGGIWKNTSRAPGVTNVGSGSDADGADYYLVASKLVTQLPRPVLFSGGLVSTDGQVTGVFGYNQERDQAWFGNVDVVLAPLVVGFEYRQGAEFVTPSSTFRNANYYDIHAAWLANEHLSLIAAYVNAGDWRSATHVGLGEGFVASAQYAF